ncbi:choice-of-anchor X domain-containing protein [Paraferrimonas sedimenticola]|uniref:TIGR03503 family protein n=1 Tax=Paraferrimonas sedimenticola TaxID=375674 RepID=A0AA37RVK7_9GAMM|nr:choice-of-anchor X domain-containing protein [Paraferrimonas sedimenticola]GLP96195.1 TIGR03503 family protein [Paraferrimonas sedimenticola]
MRVIGTLLVLIGLLMTQLVQAATHTQSSLLKNRFRIDHQVESVTLMIQRQYATPSVILVLPDGHKWYSDRHPANVSWAHSASADIIKIENPPAGPWQILGGFESDSMLQMVSELGIKVESFPERIFQGEQLRLTANLLTDDKVNRMPGLDFAVDWSAMIVAGDDPNLLINSANALQLGRYRDNGEGYDAAPDDGDFTAYFKLTRPQGLYQIQVVARNEVFERKHRQKVEIVEAPMSLDLVSETSVVDGAQRFWLNISTDQNELVLGKTHLKLSITRGKDASQDAVFDDIYIENQRLHLAQIDEFGTYQINAEVFSETLEGRPVHFVKAPIHVNYQAPPPPPPTPDELLAQQQAAIEAERQQHKDKVLVWVIGGNSGAVLFGGLALWLVRRRRKAAQQLEQQEAELMALSRKGVSSNEQNLTLP